MKLRRWTVTVLLVLLCLNGCSTREIPTSVSLSEQSESSSASASAAQPGTVPSQSTASGAAPQSSAGSSVSEASSRIDLPTHSTPPSHKGVPLPSGLTERSKSSSSAASSSGSGTVTTSSSKPTVTSGSTAPPQTPSTAPTGEIRAVWISYLDFNTLLKYKTQTQFTSNIGSACKKIAAAGFNTVIAQVRPFGDAVYESDIFPWSYTVTGTEGEAPGFDPLRILIAQAKQYGLRVEAWVNPYRIRTASVTAALSDENPAVQYQEEDNGAVISYGGGLYYNPASSIARDTIVAGVAEIVENYDVSAIHFDDYFYPTTDADFDAEDYQAYTASGGSLSLAAWRRENVNLLVRDVYSTIKEIRSSVQFGISPQGNMSNNYNQQYIDVEKWLSNTGYVDYICPQIYFGFQNGTLPFASTAAEWNSMIRTNSVQLYVGLAPYKLGTEDTWAGGGKTEWLSTTDILARMVTAARGSSHYGGFAMFRYDSLFNPSASVADQVKTELASLLNILQ